MPVSTTYPGVYVQEAPSGVHAISGVATSVAAFVGMCPSGQVNVPTRIFSYREYEALFGGAALVGEMSDQVRQFFMNGGSTAWIVRNAAGVTDGHELAASSTLMAEDGSTGVLTLRARSPGSSGNEIHVVIDYETADPERTFNLTAFRQRQLASGQIQRLEEEKLTGLSMDPAAARNAVKIVNETSTLLTADAALAVTPVALDISQSGLIFTATTGIKAFFDAHMTGSPKRIGISLGYGPPVFVDLAGLTGADSDAVCAAIKAKINGDIGIANAVDVIRTSAAGGDVLRITSSRGAIAISAAPADTTAATLRLGTANGGLEADRYSAKRPAANGLVTRLHTGNAIGTVFKRVHDFADAAGNSFGDWALTSASGVTTATPAAPFGLAAKLGADGTTGLTGVFGTFAAVAAALDQLVTSINAAGVNTYTAYRAGLRLGVRVAYGNQDADLALALTSTGNGGAPYTLQGSGNLAQSAAKPTNVARYAIGFAEPPIPAAPAGDYRTFVQAGSDGSAPLPADYDLSFSQLDRTADIFNLLVLPRALNQNDAARLAIWGPASSFCHRKRAFLLVDPPSDSSVPKPWKSAGDAAQNAQDFRSGVVADHAAVYWPRIVTNDSAGKKITIDPAGTMAGVYAKTDVRRGIWKAPAGLEAALIGVRGLETLVTNEENGLTNPQAINTLRSLSAGATSWGARTMMGYNDAADQDYRYVPVRRLALYIEESLYRGLQFAVFEPNAEPLWGQIRLAVGSFMNGLFRQGAFKGLKASDAYYVACGPSTTTPTDINLGVVNVEVGFAPLKPAEFVVLTIKQMVGQIEV